MQPKKIMLSLLPPIITDVARKVVNSHGFHEWEYVPEGWRANVKGWNEGSVLKSQRERWPEFLASIEGRGPLGVSHEGGHNASENDYATHNTIISYAYVLALASRDRDSLSMLDWGGGIGHYYALSKALLPGMKIDYHCKELPILCSYGRELHPDAYFYDAEKALERKYNLVLASSSLHYSEHWKDVFARLAGAADPYLYVTRTPIVNSSASFVVVQRPYRHGYNTEYLGWFINRDELFALAHSCHLKLIREFLIQEKPVVHNAPEQCDYRGFLFRRDDL